MQFNLVVSTNEAAVHLWQDLGFAIVGTIPEAFDHPEFGLVDAYVMHGVCDRRIGTIRNRRLPPRREPM